MLRSTSSAHLAGAFVCIRDARTMRRFLSEILTPAEFRDMHLRWKLMQMLSRGIAQRAIAARLGVSLCKITRGAKILKQRASVCRRLIEADLQRSSITSSIKELYAD